MSSPAATVAGPRPTSPVAGSVPSFLRNGASDFVELLAGGDSLGSSLVSMTQWTAC